MCPQRGTFKHEWGTYRQTYRVHMHILTYTHYTYVYILYIVSVVIYSQMSFIRTHPLWMTLQIKRGNRINEGAVVYCTYHYRFVPIKTTAEGEGTAHSRCMQISEVSLYVHTYSVSHSQTPKNVGTNHRYSKL